jgi:hypothetical protein
MAKNEQVQRLIDEFAKVSATGKLAALQDQLQKAYQGDEVQVTRGFDLTLGARGKDAFPPRSHSPPVRDEALQNTLPKGQTVQWAEKLKSKLKK